MGRRGHPGPAIRNTAAPGFTLDFTFSFLSPCPQERRRAVSGGLGSVKGASAHPPEDALKNQRVEYCKSKLYSPWKAEPATSLGREGVSEPGIVDSTVKEKVAGMTHLHFHV